jgi:aminopeptidase N
MEKNYTYLKDYKPLDYVIETANLTFDLKEDKTIVKSVLKVTKTKNSKNNTLVLNGEKMKLNEVKVNGKVLNDDEYELTSDTLKIKTWPETFTLEIENEINPIENKELEGLYLSGKILCTQNEPEGFRRITYFIDRPDNMTIFTVKLIADKNKYPTLLSNGNLVEQGDIGKDKHYAVFFDPSKKPSYLFALVAGKLDLLKDTFTSTISKRRIELEIYSDSGNKDKSTFAMESLKNAFLWDEEKFGRECDLDTYRIVAVDSFNMGAMENKGLNIFNSLRILSDKDTATDDELIDIEDVIGHEYFHNWTGNRITCRDWFQLTLKEGLTIYRDQEFSADMRNRDLRRIEEIEFLKTHQFPEDESGNKHPIKPDKYMEINNFYTTTIYWKGAEVIRMLETLFGKKGFRKGMDLYFKRHDGMAVTTEEFVNSIGDANKTDLAEFKKWYHTKGVLFFIIFFFNIKF